MKKVLILTFSRTVKLLANVVKVLSYIFHWLFPSKRFQIPEYAKPLLSKPNEGPIPKTIWQTNFTDKVTLPVYVNYLFNRIMAPSYEYRFMITESRSEFVATFYPEEFAHYKSLQIGAAQADFWRLLILNKFGGVYLDIDAHLVWSLSDIIGSENEELYITTRRKELSNYFIASRSNNNNLKKVIDKVVENISLGSSDNVFYLTGPGVLQECLAQDAVPTVSYRYAVNQGNFTNEYFQYIDKPEGKWNKQQRNTSIIIK